MTKSALQIARAAYQPKVPAALKGAVKAVEGAYTQSVADQDEIADRAVESRQDGSLADRLQDHVDNPGSNVFGRGVAVRLSEVGGGGVQRQVGQFVHARGRGVDQTGGLRHGRLDVRGFGPGAVERIHVGRQLRCAPATAAGERDPHPAPGGAEVQGTVLGLAGRNGRLILPG